VSAVQKVGYIDKWGYSKPPRAEKIAILRMQVDCRERIIVNGSSLWVCVYVSLKKPDRLNPLMREATEIIAILVSSINTAKRST
jgi:hypothetical protein